MRSTGAMPSTGAVCLAELLPPPSSGAREMRRVAAVSVLLSGSSCSSCMAVHRSMHVVAIVAVAFTP